MNYCLYSISPPPSPWSILRLNAGCFPTNKTHLYVTNIYYPFCQVPKMDTCQAFYLWVRQCYPDEEAKAQRGWVTSEGHRALCGGFRTRTSISWVLGSGLSLLSVPASGANWLCKNICVFSLRAFREKPCLLLRTSVMVGVFSLHRKIYGSGSWQDTDGTVKKNLVKGPGTATYSEKWKCGTLVKKKKY